MSWPPIPASQKPISAIKIPKHLCFQAPYSIASPLPENERESLVKQTQLAELPASEIIARPSKDGEYEVLYGWPQLLIWVSLFGGDSIPMKVAAYDNHEAIRLALRETYEHKGNEVHRMWLSRALLQAKNHFQLSDKELSTAMGDGYSRSTVTNLLRLNKLKKSVQDAYLQGKIKHSYAKALCSANIERQDELLTRVVSGRLNLPALEAELGYEPSQKQSKEVVTPREKTADEKRFEVSISEALGAPVSLVSDKGQGDLRAQFFTLHELSNIAEKLNPTGKATQIKGEVVIQFSSYGELGKLTDPILGNEDDF